MRSRIGGGETVGAQDNEIFVQKANEGVGTIVIGRSVFWRRSGLTEMYSAVFRSTNRHSARQGTLLMRWPLVSVAAHAPAQPVIRTAFPIGQAITRTGKPTDESASVMTSARTGIRYFAGCSTYLSTRWAKKLFPENSTGWCGTGDPGIGRKQIPPPGNY